MNRSQGLTLVTGGAGFVGNNLCRCLLSLGRPVRVLGRRPSPSLQGLDLEFIRGDLLDEEQLERAMDGVEIVHHTAAVISIDQREDPTQMMQVNVDGTRKVVEAALKCGVRRFVHFGSIHAISYAPRDEPIHESRKLAHESDKNPLPYDLSKAAAQRVVLEAVDRGLDAVILNPVGIIGPHDFKPSPTGEMLLQLLGHKLPALVRAGFYWVDSRDVALAAVAAELRGKTGEHYILKGEYAQFSRIAEYVSQASGAQPPRFNVSIRAARAAAPLIMRLSQLIGQRPLITPESIEIVSRHQRIETNKAENELGFNPRPLRTTILDTIEWLQEHRMKSPSKKLSSSDKCQKH